METTLTSRIVQGQANDLGWRELELGPGEPHADVVPAGEVLGCIWHLSDLHLCDAESPVRIEYLDRLADPDSPVREEIGEVGTYRPQEILTVHVATAMVNTANALSQGPVTRAPVNAMLITGDVTDNAQSNELDWYTTVVNGGQITPASGGEHSSWCGVSEAETWDEHYWHPDGPPTGMPPDRPTRLYGFPRIPGLIEAARQPVTSPGVMYPILSVHGNHDALLQGTVAPDARLRDYAIGGEAITGLSEGFDPRNIIAAVAPNGPARYLEDPDAPRRMITADGERRLVRPGEFATAAGRDVNYWVQDFGRLRFICLDTVNPYGGWQGSLDEIQFLWLRAQLEAVTEKYVVIASHHPSPTMTNAYAPDGQKRILGSQVVSLLLDYPNVIAWIAGHVHFNAAIHHQPGHDDADSDDGFWEITTSSLIDWPQQGRIFEFIAVGDRVAIVSTVVDHASPQGWSPGEPLDVSSMAGISRLLAANDYQRRDPTPLNELRAGSPEVRNAVWWSRVH